MQDSSNNRSKMLLTGYAVPLDFDNTNISELADHTYVKSSSGEKWGCWGRCYGGREICQGEGSPRSACIYSTTFEAQRVRVPFTGKCLPHRAGVFYGITGVCHQTANRALRPANQLVDGAKGYFLSFLLFGHYGKQIVGETVIELPVVGPEPVVDLEWSTRKKRCGIVTSDPGSLHGGQQGAGKEEILHEVRKRLGKDLSGHKQASLLEAHTELVSMHDDLLEASVQLSKGTVDSAYLARGTNEFAGRFLEKIARALTDAEYFKLFDVESGKRLIVVVPEICEGVYSTLADCDDPAAEKDCE